jgi:hypothetical protein
MQLVCGWGSELPDHALAANTNHRLCVGLVVNSRGTEAARDRWQGDLEETLCNTRTYITDLQSYLATYLLATPCCDPPAGQSVIYSNGLGSIVPGIPTMNPLLFALLTILLIFALLLVVYI